MKAIASLVVFLGLGGGLAVYLLNSGGQEQPGTVEAGDEAAPDEAAAAMQAEAEAAPKPEVEKKYRLYFQDGTWLPALNGAENPSPVMFHDRPWSPVISKEVDYNGKEWYVHADGTRSTTVWGFRRDLGRMDSITQVAHPIPMAPLAPEHVTGPGGTKPPTGSNAPGAKESAPPPTGKK